MSTKRDQRRRYDAKRLAEQPWRAWYKTKAWLTRRDVQLAAEPLCQRCKAKGELTPATIAHHVIPHRGDHHLFFAGELTSSCQPCHDIVEQTLEVSGYVHGVNASGRPLDRSHPWNLAKGEG